MLTVGHVLNPYLCYLESMGF